MAFHQRNQVQASYWQESKVKHEKTDLHTRAPVLIYFTTSDAMSISSSSDSSDRVQTYYTFNARGEKSDIVQYTKPGTKLSYYWNKEEKKNFSVYIFELLSIDHVMSTQGS